MVGKGRVEPRREGEGGAGQTDRQTDGHRVFFFFLNKSVENQYEAPKYKIPHGEACSNYDNNLVLLPKKFTFPCTLFITTKSTICLDGLQHD